MLDDLRPILSDRAEFQTHSAKQRLIRQRLNLSQNDLDYTITHQLKTVLIQHIVVPIGILSIYANQKDN